MGQVSQQAQATNLATAVLGVIAVIVVILRFITRRITKAGVAADDWWILVGLLSWFMAGGLLLYGIHSDPEGGEMIDRNSSTFDYEPHVTYLRISFIAALLYFSIVTAIKVSILLMYRRVFSVDSFRYHSLLVGCLVLFWWFVGTLLTLVSCIPISRLWVGPTVGGYCFNFGIFWMSMGSVELVIDTLILVLPVSMVVKLWMSRQQKILITGIFLLGGFVIVTGLIRVVLGYKPGSQNVEFPKAELWSSVHIGTAIICACLPTLRPFLTRASKSISKMTQRYGSGATKIIDGEGGHSGNSSEGSKKRVAGKGHELEQIRSISTFNDLHSASRESTRENEEPHMSHYPGFDFDSPTGLGRGHG